MNSINISQFMSSRRLPSAQSQSGQMKKVMVAVGAAAVVVAVVATHQFLSHQNNLVLSDRRDGMLPADGASPSNSAIGLRLDAIQETLTALGVAMTVLGSNLAVLSGEFYNSTVAQNATIVELQKALGNRFSQTEKGVNQQLNSTAEVILQGAASIVGNQFDKKAESKIQELVKIYDGFAKTYGPMLTRGNETLNGVERGMEFVQNGQLELRVKEKAREFIEPIQDEVSDIKHIAVLLLIIVGITAGVSICSNLAQLTLRSRPNTAVAPGTRRQQQPATILTARSLQRQNIDKNRRSEHGEIDLKEAENSNSRRRASV